MNKQIKVVGTRKPKIRFFSKIICTTVCVYQFYNSYHNKYYVGQTLDARSRFFDHAADLERNVHYSVEFQKDYNEIKNGSAGKKNLDPHEFIKLDILYSQYLLLEPDSVEMDKIIFTLRQKEKEFINQLREQNKTLYNKIEGNYSNVKRPVLFKDPLNKDKIYYESVAECEADLKKYFRTLTEKEIKQYNDCNVYISRSAIMKRADNNKVFSYVSQAEYEKVVQEYLDKE